MVIERFNKNQTHTFFITIVAGEDNVGVHNIVCVISTFDDERND